MSYTKLAGLGVVGVLSFFAFAGVASANHVWGNSAGAYHWARTANPLTLQLGSNVASSWTSALNTASADWTQSSVLDTKVVAGKGGRTCKATVGRVEVCSSRYGYNGWLGIAQIWITTGNHITQGLVKMNDTYFNTSTYNKASWRSMVVCQEIGHTFGLGHQDEVMTNKNLGSCMDYTNNPMRNDGAGTNLKPNAHDYELLDQIYTHLDTTSTATQSSATTPARGAALQSRLGTGFDMSVPAVQAPNIDVTDDPKTWGQEIRRSVGGQASVFSKKVDGTEVLTHVFWADPQEGEHDHE